MLPSLAISIFSPHCTVTLKSSHEREGPPPPPPLLKLQRCRCRPINAVDVPFYFQVQPYPGLSLASAREGSTVYELCRCVRNFFYAYNNEGDFKDTEERQWRMRGCVETAASLVCCTRVELGLFGKVEKVLSKVLSKLGDKERSSDPLTIISNQLFTVR
jgi:hypothetical protein